MHFSVSFTDRGTSVPGRVLAALVVLAALAADTAAADVTLEQIMQDPDWIGPPVEAAWWQYGNDGYIYRVKRAGTTVRDHFRMDAESGEPDLLASAELVMVDGSDQVVGADGARVLSVLDGSLLLRERGSRDLTRLFTAADAVTQVQFAADGNAAQFRAGERWWQVPLDASGAAWPVSDLRFEDAPHAAGDDDFEGEQLRLFSTLERERSQEEDEHRVALERESGAPRLGSAPWYLGKGHEAVSTALSPDGRFQLVVVHARANGGAEDADGRADDMPHYVARSGYVEIEDVRTLVGREPPRPQALWLLDHAAREKHEIDLAGLSGIGEDPLAALKKAQNMDPHDGDDPRPVRITQLVWHPAGGRALIQVRSIDNKDRWTLRLNAQSRALQEIHRLTDSAWINPYRFNELGWVPGTVTPWLLSEESGYGHLYTIDAQGNRVQHTSGAFEVSDVAFTRDGSGAYLLANRARPTEWDLYRLTVDSGELVRVTQLRGVESYALHADEDRALLRHSSSYTPTQAAILSLGDGGPGENGGGSLSAQTDTRTAAYRALEWQAPSFVGIPSSHVEKNIWTKFYPARGNRAGPRPIVVFVHGAGYTQNTHHKFPYYFREQMFHNLLTARGYHVIDMDYRASSGYGRDWRTAIYRHMGKPELEDLIDGVNWVAKWHDGDLSRVGVYGGSYGGFMTLTAMFQAPETFAAGAALRPVTDWRHYNHSYTANILNTPQVDPEAHRVSSPIEFAGGLDGHLLISHGMLDDNVFYKDSVRLAQRLIELKKENWELASYPLEPHGYVHPESWLDQYRRIYRLFEATIGQAE